MTEVVYLVFKQYVGTEGYDLDKWNVGCIRE